MTRRGGESEWKNNIGFEISAIENYEIDMYDDFFDFTALFFHWCKVIWGVNVDKNMILGTFDKKMT